MIIKLRNTALLIFSVLTLLMASCSSSDKADSNESAGESTTLSFAYEVPEDNPWGKGAEKFKEVVEDKTNGEIEINIHGGGAMGDSGEEIQEGIDIGTIDIGISSTPLGEINPYVQIFSLPYLFEGKEDARAVLDGSIGDRVSNHLEKDYNIKNLSYWEDGVRQITNSQHPINKPEDLEGLRIRVPESSLRIATFEAWEAKPLSMSFSEVYTGLQQGTLDGQENPLSVIDTSSFYDVQDYLTISEHVYSPASLLINLDKWEELSSEQQEIVMEAAEEGREVNRDLNDQMDEELIEKLEGEGMEITEIEDISSFQELSEPIYDQLIDEIDDESDDEAKEILDEIEEFVQK